jgi:hypothetical protein
VQAGDLTDADLFLYSDFGHVNRMMTPTLTPGDTPGKSP